MTIIEIIDWIETNSAAIQAISMLVLVVVTGIYAWGTYVTSKATKEQAEASVRMADEMRKQRYDTVRPVIDIRSILYTKKGQDILFKDLSSCGVTCTLHNIGLGPAIDVNSCIQDGNQQSRNFNFGTLVVGGGIARYPLSLNQEEAQRLLVVSYKDVYDRHFKSTREVQIVKENADSRLELGPLKSILVEEHIE